MERPIVIRPSSRQQVLKSYKTPVAQAIIAGDTRSLEQLLCAGADLNEFSYFRGHGESPLLTAVRYARKDMITVLLSHGADVNLASSRGHTPLLRSSQRNYFSILCQLLSHGADPNAMDVTGRSPLVWAIKLRNLDTAKELVKFGANVNLANPHGPRPSVLHFAVSGDLMEITKYLLSCGSDVNAVDDSGETPLFSAIRVDNMETVQSLLDKGSSVNAINQDYRTPLHLSAASVHNNVDLTQLLVDHGAHVNALDRYRNTPLVLSLNNYILRPNYAVAKCLIQHGSDLRDEACCKALAWAVEAHGNFDVVKFAIEAGFRLSGVSWVQDLIQNPNRRRWLSAASDAQQEKQFIEYITHAVKNCPSLAALCQGVVREHLIDTGYGQSIYQSIQRLPLPEAVKLFLMMEDQ